MGFTRDSCPIIDWTPPIIGQIVGKSPSPPPGPPIRVANDVKNRVANDNSRVANACTTVFDVFPPGKTLPELKNPQKPGRKPPQNPQKPQKRPPIRSKRGFLANPVGIVWEKRRLWGFQKGYIYSYTLRYLGFSFRISTVSGPFRAKSRFQVFDPFYRDGVFPEIPQITLFSTQNFAKK